MSVVIRLKVPIEMHHTVIPMGTFKVNSSPGLKAGQNSNLIGNESAPIQFAQCRLFQGLAIFSAKILI